MTIKKTDCGMCGAPRPGQKFAGICPECFDLHIAMQRFNVRAMTYKSTLRVIGIHEKVGT